MRVETDGGAVIQLGTVETAPTIGIVDYSRRVTDDFGVTTVAERGFARRMSVRLAVPLDQVDALQASLAALRATPALWVADDAIQHLKVRGFYKDFAVDLAVPPISYCTLTVEGFATSELVTDTGVDPAPAGQASTLQLLQPVVLTDAMLVASNVAETDHAAWAAGTTYALGARVLRGGTHRIYESLAGGNIGNDPLAASGKWLDAGPTRRWAMFDGALGTATTAAGSITVTLSAGSVDAVALLDVVGATVRVQAPGYDSTKAVAGGSALFLDLPLGAGNVTVTITGSGTVAVGTLLIGRRVRLGVTEASPTAGITDYSRKEVDEFGAVTIVERAWAKRMTARALIATAAVDDVASRIAAVRARPALWVGEAGLNSLTVFGFFKDFSIEVGEQLSKLSLSIEGLSKAAPLPEPDLRLEEVIGAVEDVKVAVENAQASATDAATASTKITTQMLRSMADRELARLRDRALAFPGEDGANAATLIRREAVERVVGDAAIVETLDLIGTRSGGGEAFLLGATALYARPDGAGGTVLEAVGASLGEQRGKIEDVRQVLATDSATIARAILQLDVGGRVVGMTTTNNGETSSMAFVIDAFSIETPAGVKLLYADGADGGRVKLPNVEVDTLKIDTVKQRELAQGAAQKTAWGSLATDLPVAAGATATIFSTVFTKEDTDSALRILVFLNLRSGDDLLCDVSVLVDGVARLTSPRINLQFDLANSQAQMPLTPFTFVTGLAPGEHTIAVIAWNRETNAVLTAVAGSALEVTELRKASIGAIDGGGGALPPPGSGGSGTGSGGGYDGNDWANLQ